MARKRSKRRSSRSRRRRGMGSIVTVRRKRGMGALKGTSGAVVAPLVGGGVTALATLGIRQYVDPAAGETQRKVVKWAWLLGWGGGLIGSAALYFLGGSKSEKMALAATSAVSATAVGLTMFGYDKLLERCAAELTAATAAAASQASQASAEGDPAMNGIVFRQLNGMGAIVPEYGMSGLGSPYGESVSLRGVDTSVFGRSPF